jgi:hypothetical protein
MTQIEQDLSNMATKWLVLETPVPEEIIVAAARLKYDASRNGHVDVFYVSNADDNTMKSNLVKRLLSVVETVCFNIGLNSLILEAPQWRVDLDTMFTECGYVEASGHMWPEELSHQLLKPTMILEYHKNFPKSSASDSKSGTSSSSSMPMTINMTMNMSSGDEICGDEISGDKSEVPVVGNAKAAATQVPVDATSDKKSVNTGYGTADPMASIIDQLTNINDLSLSSPFTKEGERISTSTNTNTNTNNLHTTEMPKLFEDLFAALHAEYGAAEDGIITPASTTTGVTALPHQPPKDC